MSRARHDEYREAARTAAVTVWLKASPATAAALGLGERLDVADVELLDELVALFSQHPRTSDDFAYHLASQVADRDEEARRLLPSGAALEHVDIGDLWALVYALDHRTFDSVWWARERPPVAPDLPHENDWAAAPFLAPAPDLGATSPPVLVTAAPTHGPTTTG